MKHTLLLTILIINTLTLCGQTNYTYQPRVEGFEYIDIAKNAGKAKLPLLIAFHYSSGNPSETVADYDSLKKSVRIIIPKGNYKKRNGFSYYPADYYQKDSLTQFSIAKTTVDSIARFVQSVEKKYKQKAIVSGISQGGDIALLLAIYYPELCKASFPFAAVINPNIIKDIRIKPVKKVPIYLFQGEADQIVSVSTTRRKVKEIGNSLRLKLYTYPDVGHDISTQMKIDYSKLIDKMNE
jgi:phospholipase/carboxylesterase